MNTRGWMTGLAMVAVVCTATGTARAFERGAAMAGGPLQHIIEARKELDLTEAQVTKLKALVKEFEASHDTGAIKDKIKNNPEMRETMREMKAAKESGDENRMKELRKKMLGEEGGKGGIAKGEGGHGDFIKKIAEILTPEQMQKMKAMREAKGDGPGGKLGGKGKGDNAPTDKAQKPDATKGVPNPFE